ncbi:hypothetical protein [Salipaludibacillus daqingensis]|uniref:hypothetical protein n=1 Tax=Salipaludibacillus daqingensis TaxID=3041001 RepID=UPI00247373D0|nr:hypothetical protein [Salipaludibacillus daqingensis]
MKKKHTKLVDCGSTVFVYDYESKRDHNKFKFEVNTDGQITNLKRLFIKNFINEHLNLNLSFTLHLEMSDLPNLQVILDEFTASLKKYFDLSAVKYLAVLELPIEDESSHPKINIVTDIDYFQGTMSLMSFYKDLSEEDILTKLQEQVNLLSSKEVFVDYDDTSMMMDTFVEILTTTLKSPLCTIKTRSVFKYNLKNPKIRRNEKAEDHIKKRGLLSFPYQESAEIYDKRGGFINVNVYSKNINNSDYPSSIFEDQEDILMFNN